MEGILLLEDGSRFEGVPLGPAGERVGEVILYTAVVGYQEAMTDPANAGKILVFTYPLIGNCGVASKFSESRKCWLEGVVIKEASLLYSNWQAEDSLDSFLIREGVTALNAVDTRTLAITIRDRGEMFGIISPNPGSKSDLLKKLKERKGEVKRDWIKYMSVKEITEIDPDGNSTSGPKIGILDLGVLNNFLKQLHLLGCRVILLPYTTSAETIGSLDLDGLLISSGPEGDVSLGTVAEVVKRLIGTIPLLGIATGHQVICCALGGRLRKMKVGHHGVNYSVRSSSSYKGDVTVQNHSWVVDETSLSRDDITVTLRNLHDDTIEEVESDSLGFIATQYYPVSLGFEEVHQVFRRFLKMAGH